MSEAISVTANAEIKRRIVALAGAASMEITPHDEGLVPALAQRLPPSTTVYIAHTPKATLQDVVRVALTVQASGLRACPHVCARRIGSARELRDAALELADAGIEQALVIAGDSPRPQGSFATSHEVLESGILSRVGIRRIGVAAHPEGHPAIGPVTLLNALRAKQALAVQDQLQMHVVTQFGFAPVALCAWLEHMAQQGISLPIYVGLAGPAPLPKLIKYAMLCGVGASLRGLLRNMPAMRNVAGLALTPDEMLWNLLRSSRGQVSPIVGLHLFAFGGAMATARWLRAIADGCFELPTEGGRFVLTA